MFETPYVMKMAQNLARYSGARQAQIAKNIANADTPGYRSRDLVEFNKAYQQQSDSGLRTTRAKHLLPKDGAVTFASYDIGGEETPNGNTVSVELEMVRGTDAKSSHDMALSVYRSSLDILRTSLGRGR